MQEYLQNWYIQNKRDLPWRHTQDPYIIWLSEVILQQTRVVQGLPYFLKFSTTYPSIKDLAEAPLDDVMKLWQGLGYYSRARNMHHTANLIYEKYGNSFPTSYEQMIALKGIGPYTASAVASFAFNLPYAVLDGNVNRVLSRLFMVDEPINSSKGKKIFESLSTEFLDINQPAMHNQAIMELGALVCLPQNPKCAECPLNTFCTAMKKNVASEFPKKIKKQKPRDRYFNYIFIKQNNQTFLNQRFEKDIWQHLFEFPLIETKKKESLEEMLPQLKTILDTDKINSISCTFESKHQLTHQTIWADFWEIEISKIKPQKEWLKVDLQEIKNYAVPRLLEKFLIKHNLQ
jgi:A/G-specific adenine glycosylase